MNSCLRYVKSSDPHCSLYSNSSLTGRKRSRTQSGGSSDEFKQRDCGLKCQTRQSKYRTRLSKELDLLNDKKKTKKNPKKKFEYCGLQNTIVLAPFSSLKKSFQKKLVNFYSAEKLKKMNLKTKAANKRNMAFEYDVIELKPGVANFKKETRQTRKPNQKLKHCQCKKTTKKRGKNAKFKGRKGGTDGAESVKKKKLNENAPKTLKMENNDNQRFYVPKNSSYMSVPGVSSWGMSSQSECGYWDVCSNVPSSKEEYIEGTLAISNTSLDCLNTLEKNVWDMKNIRRRSKSAKDRKSPELNVLDKHFKSAVIFERESDDIDQDSNHDSVCQEHFKPENILVEAGTQVEKEVEDNLKTTTVQANVEVNVTEKPVEESSTGFSSSFSPVTGERSSKDHPPSSRTYVDVNAKTQPDIEELKRLGDSSSIFSLRHNTPNP